MIVSLIVGLLIGGTFMTVLCGGFWGRKLDAAERREKQYVDIIDSLTVRNARLQRARGVLRTGARLP